MTRVSSGGSARSNGDSALPGYTVGSSGVRQRRGFPYGAFVQVGGGAWCGCANGRWRRRIRARLVDRCHDHRVRQPQERHAVPGQEVREARSEAQLESARPAGRPRPQGIQGARGLQGQAGILGTTGDPGTAREYGSVPSSCAPNDSPPTSCTLSASSNATVTHPFTGIYCISVPNVTPVNSGAIATLEDNVAADRIAYVSSVSCPQTTFEIQVVNSVGNVDQAFFFAVP